VIDDGDFYHQEYAQIENIYDIGEPGGFALRNHFSVYFKTMGEYSDKNIFFGTYAPSLIYSIGHQTFLTLKLQYDNMFYGSDPYLTLYTVRPSVAHVFSPTLLTRLSLYYQYKKSESNLNEHCDADIWGILAEAEKQINPRWTLTPTLAWQQEREDKDRPEITNVDNDAISAALRATYHYSNKISLAAGYHYRYTAYQETDPLFQSKQKERFHNISAEINYRFKPTWRFQATGGYIDNHSNQDPFTYHKYYANFNVIKEF
jgi:outer membrane receptor protein involved in Fe transport